MNNSSIHVVGLLWDTACGDINIIFLNSIIFVLAIALIPFDLLLLGRCILIIYLQEGLQRLGRMLSVLSGFGG